MTTYSYDYTVLFARAQGFTPAHYNIIRRALEKSQKLIIILGRTNSGRSLRDPFTIEEREHIITSTLSVSEKARVIINFLYDHKYNDNRWLSDAQETINKVVFAQKWTPDPIKIALIGHAKDHTSYYLKMFPEYDFIDVPSLVGPEDESLDATKLRKYLFENKGFLPETSPYYINVEQQKALFDTMFKIPEMFEEYQDIITYKNKWGHNGQWNTSDAVVTIGGYILLIQRKKFPGKGQWAMPGGFINPGERIKAAVVRELREETGLKVPEPVLYGSIAKHDTYDEPNRDPRGRIITHAYHFNMQHYGTTDPTAIRLPKVVGTDDAKDAKWFTFAEMKAMRHNMFSDHYDIIEDLIGNL